MYSIIATIKNGKADYTISEMQSLLKKFEGQRVVISIKKYSCKKTKEQLGYYFAGIIDRASKEYGCNPDEMYALLMNECNKKAVVNKKTGELKYVPFGLSNCDKYDTCQVIDRCIRYLAENGICVETPEEYYQRREIMRKEDDRRNNKLSE